MKDHSRECLLILAVLTMALIAAVAFINQRMIQLPTMVCGVFVVSPDLK
jgi:hypothetical protein